MVKPETLYDVVKLPADEILLNALIGKYLGISYEKMCNEFLELPKLLYNQINILSEQSANKYKKDDLDRLIEEINNDYTAAGRPFDPNKYKGVTNPLCIMPGWNTFQSWHLLGTKKIKSEDISHRFYFGIDNSKLYELALVLYEAFKKANIPFYFKTDMNSSVQRTDNIVLYTSTPLLKQTLEIIELVKNQRPDLIAQCSLPSILTGKLYAKIGYAAESQTSSTSYTDLICQIFLDSLENCLENYTISDNQITRMYAQIIQNTSKEGKKIDIKRIRNRVLIDLLIRYDPNFKSVLLGVFIKSLNDKGIDIQNICFNESVRKEIEDFYGNSIVLPNGTVMTAEEYLVKNNVYYWVPQASRVTLKNGQVMSGAEFIAGALQRASDFNTFQELFLACGARVERNVVHIEKGLNANDFSQVIETQTIEGNQSPTIKR